MNGLTFRLMWNNRLPSLWVKAEKKMERARKEVEKEQQQILDAATSDLNGEISEEQAAAAAAAAGLGEQVRSRRFFSGAAVSAQQQCTPALFDP